MMQPNQIEFHHLPSEILTRIFSLLSFRQRIRLERVCRIWRQTALAFAWLEVRTLKVTNRVLSPFTRPSRSLGKLTAILHRCGPYLEELHLGPGIIMQTRFGRYFQQLAVYQKLAHLRIDERMDIWHLQQIAEHLAPQLSSLSINLTSSHKRKRKMSQKQMAFKRELAKLLTNCQKLECLRIDQLDNLFSEDEEGQLTVLMPKSVKYLQIWKQSGWSLVGDKIKLFTLLNEELFPNIQYILCNAHFIFDEYFNDWENLKIYERFYSLQCPILHAQHYSFLQLKLPIFNQLQALHLNSYHIDYFHLTQVTDICPKLEHLYFEVCYDQCSIPLHELEGLYAFQRLSSLSISLSVRYYETFHELECANGEKADQILMEIITKLDQIHPLRSLNFEGNYPNFHENYILEMLQKLRHLETFSCAILQHRKENEKINHSDIILRQNPHNCIIWDNEDLDEFFSKLKIILDGQMEIGAKCIKKSFKFILLKSRIYDIDWQQPQNIILAKWIPNAKKIRWKIFPPIRKYDYDCQMNWTYSIVLNELLDKIFGQRIRRFFFQLIE